MSECQDQKVENSELVSKIIQYNHKRICVRLEQIYWDLLEREARSRNMRLNQLVHIYYNSAKAENNKTAYLRRRAVEWMAMVAKDNADKVHTEYNEVKAILKATMQPAIIFSENQSVSKFNRAFREWLLKIAYLNNPSPDLALMRISFRRSLKTINQNIIENLGLSKREQVTILLPGLVLPVYMNVVLIKNYLTEDVVYFATLVGENQNY